MMISRTTCVALSGLLLTAVLAPAFAQTPSPAPQGAKETITIKGESEKKAEPAAVKTTTTSVTTMKKTELKRDPFVTGTATDGGSSKVKKVKKIAAKPGSPGSAADGAKGAEKKEVEVAPPQVNVHGIVLSASGNRAILVSPNQTYIVKAGDKLGDYRVAEIGAKHVTFKYKDKSFKLKMDDEFSAMAKKK